MVILHLWFEVMHEVPSVHDGPCISLLLLLLLLIRLLLLLSFTKESSATSLLSFQLPFQTHATWGESRVLYDPRASWKGPSRVGREVFRCRWDPPSPGVVGGNLGGRVCVLEGCGPAGPGESCTQSGTAAGWRSTYPPNSLLQPQWDTQVNRPILFFFDNVGNICFRADANVCDRICKMVIPAGTVW